MIQSPTMKQLLLTIVLIIAVSSQLSNFQLGCSICHDIIHKYQKSIPRKPTQLFLDQIGYQVCFRKHIQKANVCKGAVSEMMDSIVNSVWLHYTDPHAICHKLRFCPKEYKVRNLTQDIEKILKGKPEKQWEEPTKKRLLKAMHISDVHIDLFYTVGAAMNCSEPVCCRSNVTLQLEHKDAWNRILNGQHLEVKEPTEGPANYWGSVAYCDLPFQTFQLFLEEVKKMNDLDMIIWTGDNTPHDVWQQSQTYNLNFTVIESERILKATKARILPAMGNHESFPVNVYDYQGQRQQMLIGGLAEAWKPWLDQKAYDMLRTKGYFSMTLPEFNNLKVISVNTQAQNDMNWFLMRNPTDAGHMLQWIEDQLKESEANNQFVWILGHIPPNNALNEWSMRFNALTDRFSYIIRGQFYGHTHDDEIGFFPSFANKSKISNVYFTAPSLTTYNNRNPEYRVMTVDFDTLQIVDYDQYRLDLSKYTKKQDDAKFQKFYNFKQAYGLKDTTVKGGMTDFKNKLQHDNATQIQYSYFKKAGVEKGHTGKDIYCTTLSSPQYAAECRGESSKPGLLEKISGKWKDLEHK